MKALTVQKQPVSIVVPTLNEVENVHHLVARIHISLQQAHIPYEIIFIDDNSTDDTVEAITALQSQYPHINVYSKTGKPGKAFSLLEGFDKAKHPLICMIDADLQYPPESITAMHRLLEKNDYDVVITERIKQKTSFLRQVMTRGFSFVFTRLLFGIRYDSQSGLKLFKKQVLDTMQLSPSPWSFDLEFIVRSLENGYKVVSHPIQFASRIAGEPKVRVLSTALELAKASITLWFRSSRPKVKSGYEASLKTTRNAVAAMVSVIVTATLIGTLLNAPSTKALDTDVELETPSIMTDATNEEATITVPSTTENDTKDMSITPAAPATKVDDGQHSTMQNAGQRSTATAENVKMITATTATTTTDSAVSNNESQSITTPMTAQFPTWTSKPTGIFTATGFSATTSLLYARLAVIFAALSAICVLFGLYIRARYRFETKGVIS